MAVYENISGTNMLTSDFVSKVNNEYSKLYDNKGVGKTQDTEKSFDAIFNAAVGLIKDTNTYIENAQKAEIDFSLGNISNTHELGVIQQKANLALQYTVAIRDKLLEAYKEILNIQI